MKTIANVLCQLLIEEDKVESDIIKNAFIQLFKIDSKAALTSLFEQIENVEQEDAKAREQAIVFLKERVMPLASELITTNPDAEHYIATEIQKVCIFVFCYCWNHENEEKLCEAKMSANTCLFVPCVIVARNCF